MSYDLGSARGTIEMEYNGRGAAAAAQGDLDKVGQSGQNTKAALGDVARTAGRAGLVIAAGLGAGVKVAADFESEISNFQAAAQESPAVLEQIREKALQIGRDTSFGAAQAAEAITNLSYAGLSSEEILGGAADAAIALAEAGQLEVPQAASIMTSSMNAFGIEAENTAQIADNMIGVFANSDTMVDELGQALKNVSATASTAGVSFEDTTVALGLLADVGIKGGRAGSTLNRMLLNLNPASVKAKDAMKELGIITKDGSNQFFDAEGNMKSLADVSQVLQGSMKGLTKEQQLQTLQTIFGSEALTAASALAENGAEGFNSLANEMKEVSAADVAAEKLDNLKGQMTILKGSLETLGITVGTVLIPALTAFTEKLIVVANAFLSLPGWVQKTIVIFLALLAGFLLVGAATIKLVFFFQKLGAAIKIIMGLKMIAPWLSLLKTLFMVLGLAIKSLGVALLTTPIGWIIIGLVALGAGLVLLWKKSETFRDIVKGAWEGIKAAAMVVFNWFRDTVVPGLAAAWEGIKSGITSLKGVWDTIWNSLKSAVMFVFNIIRVYIMVQILVWKTIITTALNAIKATWNAIWGTLGPAVKAIFGLIKAIIVLYIEIIKLAIRAALMVIKAVWNKTWNAIKAVATAVWGAIKAVVTTYVNIIKTVISAAWKVIQKVTSTVWKGIQKVIQAVWGVIGGHVTAAVGKVKSVISAAWNAIKSATSAMWNAIVGVVRSGVDRLMDAVRSVKDKVVGFFSGAGQWLYNAGKAIIDGLIGGITAMAKKATDAVKNITAGVKNLLPGSPVKEGPLKVLNRGYAGEQIVKMVIGGMESMADPLARTMSDMLVAPDPSGYAAPDVTVRAAPTRDVEAGRTGSARLIDGELRLDPSGRAFISGVAIDMDDDHDDYSDTLSRMG